MELQKLVIASVLKPITDTRMYEKFGCSISQSKKYEVNIIGFYSKYIPVVENIKFYPLYNFTRISLGRIIAPFKFFLKIIALKPDTIIITTHELLLPSILYKLISKVKIIYDIQENYYLNIKYTNSFPPALRNVIANYVRLKEIIASPFVDRFILAEKCYENEITFIKSKYNIIKNKAINSNPYIENKSSKKRDKIQLLFSGTIAESTGIFECIELAKSLHEIEARTTLKIIGFCSDKSVYNRLKKAIGNSSFITLIGGSQMVEHSTIIEAVSNANFGLIYYPPNRANDHSIPTKLFEYLSAELPVIIENKTSITEITDQYPAAIKIDFHNYNSKQILAQMKTANFYQIKPGNEVLWSSEIPNLISII